MNDAEDSRLAELRAEITARLRPVCTDWPLEMFDEMVRGLAALTLKYERAPTPGTYDRRTTERLVEEMKSLVQRSAETRSKEPGEKPES